MSGSKSYKCNECGKVCKSLLCAACWKGAKTLSYAIKYSVWEGQGK